MRTAAIGLIIAGSAGLVLMIVAYGFTRNIGVGYQCAGDTDCVATPNDIIYIVVQLVRSVFSGVIGASAFAFVLGGLSAAFSASISIGDKMSDPRARRSLRLFGLGLAVLIALSLAMLFVTSLPSTQLIWNQGECTPDGCTYSLGAQLVLMAGAVAPSVFTAGLLAVPVLVVAGALVRQGSTSDEPEPERVAAWDGRDLAPFRRPE
jgi:hypothetical protein